MRILIWGGDSWANQGDAAVLAGTLAAVRATLPGAQMVVASGRPQVTQRRHGVPAVPRGGLSFWRALWEADLVLWGGGQMIQNASSKPFLFFQLLFLAAALRLGKRVACYAQGVGPVDGPLSRFCTRLILQHLATITLRDRASALRLAALGLAPDALYVTADPSFCVAPAPSEEVEEVVRRCGLRRPFMAIAVRRWGHYQGGWLPVRVARRGLSPAHREWYARFCRDVAAAADYCSSALGLEVLFVPMCPGGDQEDDAVAAAIRGMMAHPERARVLEAALPPEQLKGLLGQAALVLAMRTHAAMLAADAGAPLAVLSYQGKGQAFMEEVGLLPYALPVEECRRERLLELVQRAWRDRALIRRQLRARLPALRRRAWRSVELAAGAPWQAQEAGAIPAAPRAWDAARWERLSQGAGSFGDALLPGRLGGVLARRRRLCLELGQAGPGELVLDLGCGPGAFRQPVLERGARWVGLDVSPGALARAGDGGTGSSSLIRGDLSSLPLADGVASVELCVGVLDYLRPPQLPAALREIARVLRSGGRCVLTCNGSWWGQRARRALPSWMPPVLRGLGPTYQHQERLRGLLAQATLSLLAERRLHGGLLGPATHVFLCRKESPRCDSAAITAPP